MSRPKTLKNRLAQTGGTAGRASGVGAAVRSVNSWREQYNPLRGLTISRVVALRESFLRGEFADLMWTYGAPNNGIEVSDPDLLTIIERRTGALTELDWDIKVVDGDGSKIDATLAAEQQAALREAYDAIDNLNDAIEFLGMATFRGFSHLEKVAAFDGTITELRPVDQWNVVRDGIHGAWKYNEKADMVGFQSLPDSAIMDPAWFLIHCAKRPVNAFALVKFVRMNLGEKDWDAFIEAFGVPGGIVILPPNVPQGKESEYLSTAENISRGGSGALPNGSDYKPNDSIRGMQPFKERLEWLTQKLVLAGTGGMLTVLAQSGSGTLAGSAHMEAFKTLARAEGKKVSEVFQRQFDRAFLTRRFPGQPRLAYFQLASEEKNATAILEDAAKAKQAGFQMSAEEASEETGYNLTLAPQAPASTPGFRAEPIGNRHAISNKTALEADPQFVKSARQLLAGSVAKDLQPVARRLREILNGSDADLAGGLQKLRDDLPKLLKKINATPTATAALERILGSALAEGLTTNAHD